MAPSVNKVGKLSVCAVPEGSRHHSNSLNPAYLPQDTSCFGGELQAVLGLHGSGVVMLEF